MSRHKAFMLTEILHREKVYDARSAVVEANAARAQAAREAELAAAQAAAEGVAPPAPTAPTGVGRGFAASAIR